MGVATVYPAVHPHAAIDIALDVALVERHRAGDLQAFDEVYERFGEMVYNLAVRLAGNREEAADLSQEIFLRIFRHLGSFGGRSTLMTWVFRIAVNHCRDRLSRPPSADAVDRRREREDGWRFADPARGPEALALAADEGRRVAAGSPASRRCSARRWCCATWRVYPMMRLLKCSGCGWGRSARGSRAAATSFALSWRKGYESSRFH